MNFIPVYLFIYLQIHLQMQLPQGTYLEPVHLVDVNILTVSI